MPHGFESRHVEWRQSEKGASYWLPLDLLGINLLLATHQAIGEVPRMDRTPRHENARSSDFQEHQGGTMSVRPSGKHLVAAALALLLTGTPARSQWTGAAT